MSRYLRAIVPGGCFFFTLVTHQRYPWFADVQHVERLRQGFQRIKQKYPFHLDAIVVLPDHLHCVMRLPENDTDYALRWRLIKYYVARGIETHVNHRREKRVWQKRYWEHVIRNDADWQRHVDYIHYNPVKHGYVGLPADWKYSSFLRAVEKGWYAPDWGRTSVPGIDGLDLE